MRDLRELNINEMGQPVSRPAPTQTEIAEIESALGVSLPSTYKTLLQVANGGHPELNSFVPEGADSESRWSVDTFYHLSSNKMTPGSVWRAFREYSTVLRPQRFPIARDEGGNQIVLDLNESPPSVKLAIHDEDFREIPVARSLDRFLDLLSTDPDMI
jgi:cell wall assembly regulator SMI1